MLNKAPALFQILLPVSRNSLSKRFAPIPCYRLLEDMSASSNGQEKDLQQEVQSSTNAAITAPEPSDNDREQAEPQAPAAPLTPAAAGAEQVIEAHVSYTLPLYYISTVPSMYIR